MSCDEVEKTGPPLGLVNFDTEYFCAKLWVGENFSEKKYFCNAFSAQGLVEIGSEIGFC